MIPPSCWISQRINQPQDLSFTTSYTHIIYMVYIFTQSDVLHRPQEPITHEVTWVEVGVCRPGVWETSLGGKIFFGALFILCRIY